jgi:AcrR family transcriptional regulator
LEFASVAERLERHVVLKKTPTQARARETVTAILDAASQVLVELGLDRFSTTPVAERAGVSVGTLYQYFNDKDAVLTALAVRFYRRTLEGNGAGFDAALGLGLRRATRVVVRGIVASRTRLVDDAHAMTEALRLPSVRAIRLEALGAMVGATERLLASVAPSLENRALAAATLVRIFDGIWASTVIEGKLRELPPWLEDELVAAAVGYLTERGRLARGKRSDRGATTERRIGSRRRAVRR